MSPTFILCVMPTAQESPGHGAPTNSIRPRGAASPEEESVPLKMRAWTLLWPGSMSQALRCPKRTDPSGEVATHTGVWASVAAVVWAMAFGSQLAGATIFGQGSLHTLANEVLSESATGLTVQVHAFDSLHCWARLVTLLWTFCPQTFAASAGSPHARNSCVIFGGVYATVRVAGRPPTACPSNACAMRRPEPVMTNAIALLGV